MCLRAKDTYHGNETVRRQPPLASPPTFGTLTVQPVAAPERLAVKYPPHSPLRAELQRRVEAHFRGKSFGPEGGLRLGLKSGLILAWWLGSYLLLVFWAHGFWQVSLLAASLGLAVAGIGFNIQHDGGHGSCSRRRLGNRLSSLALDLMGGSSYFWHFKHNVLHHHFTNVDGVDDDLQAGPLLRLAEGQRRRWFHRFQHWYIWLLYAFLPPKWQLYDDWSTLATGRIGDQPVPRPRGWDLGLLFLGKVVFVTWAFAVPLTMHSVGSVLLVYSFCALVTGVTLGTVFQLAHCVEEAGFSRIPARDERMARAWAEHQLATTVDFAPGNRWLTWYLGGLNFQVEHHLFPRVSHIHYRALAPVIRSVCVEFRVPHHSHETMWGALRSHVRYLKRMGRRSLAPA